LEEVFSEKIVDNIITEDPSDRKEQYQINSVHDGYVKAQHANGRFAIKFFPEEKLLAGKWWVKVK
jgi:hypothetical protein